MGTLTQEATASAAAKTPARAMLEMRRCEPANAAVCSADADMKVTGPRRVGLSRLGCVLLATPSL